VTALHFSIGGMRIRVEAAEPFPANFVGDRLALFQTDEAPDPPDILVHWERGDPPCRGVGPLIYAPGSIWRLHRSADGEGYAAVISYAQGGELVPQATLVEADEHWRTFRVTENAPRDAFQSLLNLGAGELIVRTRILFLGGIVFHACAIDDGGRGILMVGHSGAGKSTQSLIWSGIGATVLSDDRIAVRLKNGAPVAYGTPWGGTADIAHNGSVPLRAVLVLEQAPVNELVPLTGAEALSVLLVRSFLPYWNADLMNRAMDTVSKLMECVPVYIFRCRPDESVVPVVRSVL